MINTVDAKEIQQFSKDSERWWDESGPFKPLHRLNPVRLSYIKQQICDHFDREMDDLKAIKGLNILDIGCGGGLVCEPLARLGGNITGADADAQAIEVAKEHAQQSGLDIQYFNGPAEDLLSSSPPLYAGIRMPAQGGHNNSYDVVLALEIIEHVTDIAAFVKTVSTLVKPGGLVIFSTLNRNPKSFLMGIVAAEYILRWVPRGTHHWKKFIKPSELARYGRSCGLHLNDLKGIVYNPISDNFQVSSTDTDVNYITCLSRLGGV